MCHAYGGKIPRNHPGHQTTFCMGDFFCCRFLEKRYAHSPLALLAPFPSQPQASWGVRFAGKRICIAHAKKPFALPMQKLKRLCIDQAKNKKKIAFPMPKIKKNCIANAKKLKKNLHCQCKKFKQDALNCVGRSKVSQKCKQKR